MDQTFFLAFLPTAPPAATCLAAFLASLFFLPFAIQNSRRFWFCCSLRWIKSSFERNVQAYRVCTHQFVDVVPRCPRPLVSSYILQDGFKRSKYCAANLLLFRISHPYRCWVPCAVNVQSILAAVNAFFILYWRHLASWPKVSVKPSKSHGSIF